MWTIFRREVGQYFASPIAYLIAFAFLIMTAFSFNRDLALSVQTKPADPAAVAKFLSFGMIFIAPLLTMRMMAEEGREGTLELLLTAPVKDIDIVLGKFLSAWFYYTLLLFLTLPYQIILTDITQPDLGLASSAYIGIWLYGGACLAVGLLFSALTENQVVAAFFSMSVLLFMWLGDEAGQIAPTVNLANLIREITLQGHFQWSFAVGLLKFEDVAFFAGVIAVALFITIRIVESRRWR